MIAAAVLIELIVMFFLSQEVTKVLFTFFLLLLGSRTVAVTILLVLDFPGTVVHELSHLFTAEILRVHTGKMTLVPESLRTGEIKAGSVMIGQSDPFRRYAIGFAPIFSGILLLTAISYFLPGLIDSVTSGAPLGTNPATYYLLAAGYCMFAISNNMFSSKEDLKGFIPFAIALTILTAALYVIGIRINITGQVLVVATKIATTLAKSLGVVLGVNAVILVVTKLFLSLLAHARRVRIS